MVAGGYQPTMFATPAAEPFDAPPKSAFLLILRFALEFKRTKKYKKILCNFKNLWYNIL